MDDRNGTRGGRSPDEEPVRRDNAEAFPTRTVAESNDQTALLEARVRQQAAVADLGQMALAQVALDALMDEAVTRLRDTLAVDYAKVLELLPDGDRLLLRSGVGWSEGLVGRATVSAGSESQAGFTLLADEPVIVQDLATETRFSGPSLLIDHGVTSGMSVIIRGTERPYGVLGVHSKLRQEFTRDDLYVLQSIANILAMAIERKRVDGELYRRHQEFQALGQNAPDIITRFDHEQRHLFINDAIERYTGIPASEFIGKTNEELGIDPEQVRQWDSTITRAFETGEEQWLEFSYQEDDERHWFQSRIAPEFDQDGEVRSVLAVTRDVTQQRAAAEQLRQSEERFRSLSASSPVGIIVSDVNGNITYLNPRFEEITGIPIPAALGRGWISYVEGGEQAEIIQECSRALMEGREADTEARIGTPGQSERWVQLRVARIQNDIGETTGYVATVQDITSRKHVERHLRFLADAGKYMTQSLDVRRTAQAITDLAVPELADYCTVQIYDGGFQLTEVIVAHRDPQRGPAIVDEYRRHIPHYREPHPMARVLRTREPCLIPEIGEHDWEGYATNPDHLEVIRMFQPRSLIIMPMIARDELIGTISFLYSYADSTRTYSEQDLELASDLADRAALAIDNARLYGDAQTAIRAREEFLSIASHELKTPLTSVKGYAQLLEKSAADDQMDRARVHTAASRVREQVGRLEALINDLLDVSRIQQGKLGLRLTHVDLKQLARTVLDRFKEGSDVTPFHHVHVVGPQSVHGNWDVERMDQVITNLLSNALKYSPEGGEITIELSQQGDRVALEVSDQGIGIPREDRATLFRPFSRRRRNPDHITGTGLGLYIVRQIVLQHGGDISVESVEGEGSRFTVTLPLDSSAAPPTPDFDPESDS